MNFLISVNSLKSHRDNGVTSAWGDALLLLLKVEKIDISSGLINESTGNTPLQILERNAKLGWVYVLHNNEGDRRATDL